MAVPGKRELRLAIKEHGGVIADIAKHFTVSRQTVYRWLDDKNLRSEIPKARARLSDVSTDVIYQRLFNEDEDKAFEAAKFVKLHMNDDGHVLTLTPRLWALMLRMGISGDQLVAELEGLLPELVEAS